MPKNKKQVPGLKAKLIERLDAAIAHQVKDAKHHFKTDKWHLDLRHISDLIIQDAMGFEPSWKILDGFKDHFAIDFDGRSTMGAPMIALTGLHKKKGKRQLVITAAKQKAGRK